MAITIIQNPQNQSLVLNPMDIVIDSTNKSSPQFTYIIQVEVASVVVATMRVAPDITFGYGRMNLGGILRDYLSSDFFQKQPFANSLPSTNTFLDYTVKFGEGYEVSGVYTEFLNLDNFTAWCFNGGLPFVEWVNYNPLQFDMTSTSSQFLDSTTKVLLNQRGFATFVNTNPVGSIEVKTYNSSGSLVQTATLTNTQTSKIAMMPSAPVSLNAATLTTGTQPLITSSISYYTIQAKSGGGSAISKVTKYNIEPCGFAVYFLNKLGGYSSFPFLTIKQTNKIERKTYLSNAPTMTATGVNYSVLDRGNVNYNNVQSTNYKLISNLLDDVDNDILSDLIGSTDVYMDLNGTIVPITITNAAFSYNYINIDGFNSLELEVETSFRDLRQAQ